MGRCPQGHANETGEPLPVPPGREGRECRPAEHTAVLGRPGAAGLAQAEVPTSTPGDSLTSRHRTGQTGRGSGRGLPGQRLHSSGASPAAFGGRKAVSKSGSPAGLHGAEG